MPLYEFRCESCGWTLETILAFSDPLPHTCEACGGALKKLLSAPAFQFKGSGFYLTDYGRSGGGDRAKEGQEAKDAKDAKDAKEGKPPSGTDGAAPSAPVETRASGSAPAAGSGEGGGAAKKGDA